MFSDETEQNKKQQEENANASEQKGGKRQKRTRANARSNESNDQPQANKAEGRSRLFNVGSADSGRSGEFVKYLKEILKEKDAKNTYVFQPSGDLAADLSPDLGFVVFGYYQGNNFVYHLNVFESEAKSVRETESKESRRARREEDKVYLYESLNDAIDDSIYELFEDYIKEEYEIKGEIISSGVSIIPVEMSLEDSSKLAMLAYDNEDSNILMSGGMSTFTSDDLAQNSTTKVTMDFVPQTNSKTISGLPLRSDFQVKIGEHVKDQKGSGARRTNGVNPIISYDGFVNTRWVGVDPDDDKAPLAAYAAEVVMSNSNAYVTQKFGGNFERLILAIGSMAYLKDNDAFLKGLEINLNSDIRLSSLQYGIDNIEGVSFDDIDDDSDNARKFLENVLVSDKRRSNYLVEFAMLVREGDVGASTQKIFVDAYNGDGPALQRIREAITDLCDCDEDAVFIDSAEDIFSGSVTIPYGYFQKANQTVKKLKDAEDRTDYFTVMNTAGHVNKVNEKYKLFIKNILTTDNVPASIAKLPEAVRYIALVSDTDSTMGTMQEWAMWYAGKTSGIVADAVSDALIYMGAQNIAHLMARMSANIGVELKKIFRYQMKNEFKYSSFAVTNKAKHYFALIVSQEGTIRSDPELEMKGVSLRTSNIPPVIMDRFRAMVVDLLNIVSAGEKISIVPILEEIGNIEHGIVKSVHDGECTYLKTGQVKGEQSYSKPESSNFVYYNWWETTFGPKYGSSGEPAYRVVKINVNLENKTAIKKWIEGMEDRELALRIEQWHAKNPKRTFSQFLLPYNIVASKGIPKEILDVANYRKLIYASVEPYYHVLECMKAMFINKNKTKLVSDFYGEALVKAA